MKVFLNADGYMQIQEAEGRTLLSVASGPPSNISKQSVSRTDELFPTHCPLSSSTRELGLSYFYVGCRDGRAGDEGGCLGCRKTIPSFFTAPSFFTGVFL